MKEIAARLRSVVVLACLGALQPGVAEAADGFNIDLGVYLGTPAASYGAASGQAGTWVSPNLGLNPNITNANGATTTVSVEVTGLSVNGWGGQYCSGDADKLIRDYLYRCYGPWSVELSGMQNGYYAVFVYATNVENRPLGNVVVNGVAHGQIPGTTSCDLVLQESYLAPPVEVTTQTLTVVGEYGATGTDCLGVSGIQVVPALFVDGFESGSTSAWDEIASSTSKGCLFP